MALHRASSSHDVRLDLGEGPSSIPALKADIRVRPVTIRFTEPGVPDLKLYLHSITSLRPIAAQTAHEKQDSLIFDLDEHTDTFPPIRQDEQVTVEQLVQVLSEASLMGDESVSQLKRRMGRCREGVKGRRLRLIHAGKILRDGVRLVGYLEDLDLRTRVQSRQTLRHIATDRSEDKSGSESEEEEEDEDGEEGEKDELVKQEMSVRELVDWLTHQVEADSASNPLDGEEGGKGKGKGKSRELGWFSDLIRVTTRTAPTIYLQCSVGEPLSTPEDTSSPPPAPHHLLLPPEGGEPEELESDRNRGFNRLLEAGLSPQEVASIRSQFRSAHPSQRSYDLIQSQEHAQHLLEMEERWMDSLAPSTQTNLLPAAEESSGSYMTVLQGLMVGFFLPPLIPLFWFRDKPHPSSIPSVTAAGEPDEGADEEEEWERERTRLTRESVFSSTMQVSILFGLMANLVMGLFRFIW